MICKPCTYSQESAVDCSLTSFSATSQLSLLSGSHTPAKFSANDPQKDGSPDCTCGKATLDCSIHPSTPAAWIASMRDSLAKTLALLESKVVLAKEPDRGFTAKSCVLLASFDRDSCSWKTLQQSFLTDSEPFSATWPRWGMTAAGSAYAHPMWERRITETDGLHWPTVGVRGFTNDGDLMALGRMCESLEEMNGMAYRAALKKKAQYWPTPTNHNHKETGAPSQMSRNTVQLGGLVGGQLSPDWVSWLMGFPIGFAQIGGKLSQTSGESLKALQTEWASLKATAMPKSQCKQPLHTDCLVVSEVAA